MWRTCALALAGAVWACGGSTLEPRAGSDPHARSKPVADAPQADAWAEHTTSPHPAGARAAELEALDARCGAPDAVLALAAEETAHALLAGDADVDPATVALRLRRLGAPYVWPHVWTLRGQSLDVADASARIDRWRGTFDDGGTRRCGVGRARQGDDEALVAVASDVLADLDPLPTRARPAQWLEVNATLLVAAGSAKVVVLGPRGRPRAVPTSLSGKRVHARFNADAEGAWLVQVVISAGVGPRPAAEAWVRVGPDATVEQSPAPGEDVAGDDDAARLHEMVARARASERATPLKRDDTLAGVALGHATAMAAARRLGHEVGDGNPASRAAAAGISAAAVGENVAHAPTLARAHRMLWQSPSHRDNLLDPSWNALGVGIVKDPDGSVWVAEEFAALR